MPKLNGVVMKNKILEKSYFESIALEVMQNGHNYLSENDNAWFLFGEELFDFNKKENKVYLRPIDYLFCVPNDIHTMDWIAIKKHNDDYELVIGIGNPYKNNQKELCMNINGNKIVVAVPFSLISKLDKKN
jgi:hypothetical protein